MHKCTQPPTKHKLEISDEHARNQKTLAIHFCYLLNAWDKTVGFYPQFPDSAATTHHIQKEKETYSPLAS